MVTMVFLKRKENTKNRSVPLLNNKMKIMCQSQKNHYLMKIILFQIPRKVKIEKDRVISIKKKKPIKNKVAQN